MQGVGPEGAGKATPRRGPQPRERRRGLRCGLGVVVGILNAATRGRGGVAGACQNLAGVSSAPGPRAENPAALCLSPRPSEALPSASPTHLPNHTQGPSAPTWVSSTVLGGWAKRSSGAPQEEPAEAVVCARLTGGRGGGRGFRTRTRKKAGPRADWAPRRTSHWWGCSVTAERGRADDPSCSCGVAEPLCTCVLPCLKGMILPVNLAPFTDEEAA